MAIEALTPSHLPDVAEFLTRFQQEAALAKAPGTGHRVTPATERLERLRWRLLENPFRRDGDSLGQLLVENGKVLGCYLLHPFDLVWNRRQLRIAFQSDFFVDSSARGQGLFMFRRFLNEKAGKKKFDVYGVCTANAASARLWKSMRGAEVAEANSEFLLPLKATALSVEMLNRRQTDQRLVSLLSLARPVIDFAFRPFVPRWPRSVRVRETSDWARVVAVAEAQVAGRFATVPKTEAYLEWTYGTSAAASEAGRRFIMFTSKAGDAVFVGLEAQRIGSQKQVQVVRVLDVISSSPVRGDELLAAVAAAGNGADAVVMTGRVDFALSGSRLLRRRTFDHCTTYLRSKTTDAAALAQALVVVDADRI